MRILKFIASFYFCIVMCCASADDLVTQNSNCIYINFVVAEHLLKNYCRAQAGCNVGDAERRWTQLARMTDVKGCFTKKYLFDIFAAGYNIPAADIYDTEKKQKWVEKFKKSFLTPLVDILEEVSFIEEAVVETYDGHRTDPCTPSIYTGQNNETNALCTTEHYVADSAFQKAMDTKFRLEGGCAPVQDGNCFTCYGVGAKWNNEVAQLKDNNYDMFFNREDAEKIAYNKYYYPETKLAQQIKRLPAAISGDVFMAKWGSGNAEQSIGLLQEILGVEADGMIGDKTVAAAQEYRGDLRKLFLQKRWLSMMDDNSFANGWRKAFKVYLKNGCYSTASAGDVLLKRQKNDPRCTQTRDDDVAKLANYIKTGHELCLDKRLHESVYKVQKDKIPGFREKLRLDIQKLDKLMY